MTPFDLARAYWALAGASALAYTTLSADVMAATYGLMRATTDEFYHVRESQLSKNNPRTGVSHKKVLLRIV